MQTTHKNLPTHAIRNGLQSGLKAVDQLAMRFGINTTMHNSPWQHSFVIQGRERGALFKQLPYCMQQIVLNTNVNQHLQCHLFSLPYKSDARFACFLFDSSGHLLEKVCYQRNYKYISAFKVIERVLCHRCKHELFAA